MSCKDAKICCVEIFFIRSTREGGVGIFISSQRQAQQLYM